MIQKALNRIQQKLGVFKNVSKIKHSSWRTLGVTIIQKYEYIKSVTSSWPNMCPETGPNGKC